MKHETRNTKQVKALRGDYSPHNAQADNEREARLSEALLTWPAEVVFAVVGKNNPEFIEWAQQTVVESVGEGKPLAMVTQERAGGKFITVKVSLLVSSPEVVDEVHAKLKADPRAIMSF